MPSIVKSNTAAFLAANRQGRENFLDEVRKRLNQESLFFLEKIRREQMSFPRGGPVQPDGTRLGRNPGGQLRRNWFNQSVRIGESIKVSVWSTTPYAPIHEEGGLVRFPGGMRPGGQRRSKKGTVYQVKPYKVRPYWVLYKKRLHIQEEWDKTFIPNRRAAIDKAAAQFLR